MHIIFKRILTFKQRKKGLRNNFWTLYLGFMKFCIKDKICKIVINISIIHLSAYTCTIFKGFYLLHYSIKKSFLQYIFCEHVIFERTMMSTLCLVVNKRPVYKYREKLGIQA